MQIAQCNGKEISINSIISNEILNKQAVKDFNNQNILKCIICKQKIILKTENGIPNFFSHLNYEDKNCILRTLNNNFINETKEIIKGILKKSDINYVIKKHSNIYDYADFIIKKEKKLLEIYIIDINKQNNLENIERICVNKKEKRKSKILILLTSNINLINKYKKLGFTVLTDLSFSAKTLEPYFENDNEEENNSTKINEEENNSTEINLENYSFFYKFKFLFNKNKFTEKDIVCDEISSFIFCEMMEEKEYPRTLSALYKLSEKFKVDIDFLMTKTERDSKYCPICGKIKKENQNYCLTCTRQRYYKK